MRIKPDHKNIDRKKNGGAKRNITGKKDTKQVQNKIHREFGTLTYKAVQHGFVRPVDKIFLTVIKIIDNITGSNNGSRCQNQKK